MEDFIGSFIWIIVIISAIVRFISKFTDTDRKNKTGSQIGEKIKEAFSGLSDDNKTTDKTRAGNDDNWVPAYEEKKPLEKKESLIRNNTLEKTDLARLYKQKTKEENRSNLDDEITIRDGKTVRRGNSPAIINKGLSARDKKDDSLVNGLRENDLSGEELIKGVIFKEILDAPRARKPYRPFNWK